MLFLLFLVVTSAVAPHFKEGDSCFNHAAKSHGRCKSLKHCTTATSGLKNGNYPQICTYFKRIPIVCCIENDSNVNSTKSAEISAVPIVRFSVADEGCPPLPAEALSVEKTGQKAWDYCVNLANVIFPCKKNSDGITRREDLCSHKIESIIIGGDIATPNEFPHMALLGYGNLTTAFWQCGGTLISERWVMTAAHCLYSRRAETDVKYVRLGSPDVEDTIDESNTFYVVRIVEHPDRDLPQMYNDLGLLQLDRDAIFGPSVIPACLHVGPADVERAVVSGWGVTKNKGTRSNILQEVTLENYSYEECVSAYPPSLKVPEGIDNNTQTCYGSRIEIKDSCEGDSGGPLQIQNENVFCTYTVIGIVSMGKGCANPRVPGIYTRVSAYIPWIESIVWP